MCFAGPTGGSAGSHRLGSGVGVSLVVGDETKEVGRCVVPMGGEGFVEGQEKGWQDVSTEGRKEWGEGRWSPVDRQKMVTLADEGGQVASRHGRHWRGCTPGFREHGRSSRVGCQGQ